MFDHWGDAIYWDQMTWEAFAAILAIVAAGIVGWRQVGIQKRQVEIAALTLTEAVWERRVLIYDATKAYLTHIAISSSVPGRHTLAATVTGGDVTAPAIAMAFAQAMERSRFLFRPAVHKTLNEVWRIAEALADLRADAERMYEADGGVNQTSSADLREKLMVYWRDVPAIFGDELSLTAHKVHSA